MRSNSGLSNGSSSSSRRRSSTLLTRPQQLLRRRVHELDPQRAVDHQHAARHGVENDLIVGHATGTPVTDYFLRNERDCSLRGQATTGPGRLASLRRRLAGAAPRLRVRLSTKLAVETGVPTCVALVVASGRGERFGGDRPKQYLPLAGKPLLRHCLERFCRHARIDRVRAVVHPDDAALYAAAAAGLDLLDPVRGRRDAAGFGTPGPGKPGGRPTTVGADP